MEEGKKEVLVVTIADFAEFFGTLFARAKGFLVLALHTETFRGCLGSGEFLFSLLLFSLLLLHGIVRVAVGGVVLLEDLLEAVLPISLSFVVPHDSLQWMCRK
jgi:hypothetical protein